MNLEKSGVIAICRKIYGEDLLFLAHSLYQGGIRHIEVTFDQQESDPLELTSSICTMLFRIYISEQGL